MAKATTSNNATGRDKLKLEPTANAKAEAGGEEQVCGRKLEMDLKLKPKLEPKLLKARLGLGPQQLQRREPKLTRTKAGREGKAKAEANAAENAQSES